MVSPSSRLSGSTASAHESESDSSCDESDIETKHAPSLVEWGDFLVHLQSLSLEVEPKDLLPNGALDFEHHALLQRCIVFKWEEFGWAVGVIERKATRRGFNFEVIYEGEQVLRVHRLQSCTYCFGNEAPDGSWCLLRTAASIRCASS